MKNFRMLYAAVFVILGVLLCKDTCYAKNVVVVIDPGHGGDNEGGKTEEYTERDLTPIVAKYMKERLEQYEGIEVYLTRDGDIDKDLSRGDRAKIAADRNADFMFSLHFNMSADHNLFGSEVWTSAFGEYYAKGQEFGYIETAALEELGFFDRGVKTKISSKSDDDYYGIILGGKKVGIPTVIIEHCHLDEPRDNAFLTSEDCYRTLGYTDADCVAKYFGLTSVSLGVDYSNYERRTFDAPTNPIRQDDSEPEYVEAIVDEIDEDNNIAHVRLRAHDSDSYVQYYQCSYDGGVTFDRLYPWNDDSDALEASDSEEISIDVSLNTDKETKLIVRAYNPYEYYTESEMLVLPIGTHEEVQITPQVVTVNQDVQTAEKDRDYRVYYIVGGVLGMLVLLTIVAEVIVIGHYKKKHKKGRRR